MSTVLGVLLGFFPKIIKFVFKKLGVAGILFVLLLIEIPIIMNIYDDNVSYSRFKLDVPQVIGCSEINENDGIYRYFKVAVQNNYSQYTSIGYIQIRDQNGNYVDCNCVEKYGDYNLPYARSNILLPPSSVGNVTIKVRKDDLDDVTEFNLYADFTSDEDIEEFRYLVNGA